MKKLKKLLSVALCGLMAFSAVGCGGGGGGEEIPEGYTGKETVIDVSIYDAGVNKNWLVDLAKDYEQLHLQDSYGDGEMGLRFKIDGVSSTSITANSSTHFYVAHGDMGHETARSLANLGLVVDITDVVEEKIDDRDGDGINETSIKDKIIPSYYERVLCGPDGKCYGLPSYGIKTGLTIDAYHFKSKGLYFAHPDTWGTFDSELYESKFGNAYFIPGSGGAKIVDGAKLSVGNDGIEGTADDGQPTSLQELLILCDYMKSKGISPLTAYGSSQSKRTEMLDNLWASIAGYDAYQARWDYNGTEGKDMEIVTGVTKDKFLGYDTIFNPKVETVKVNLENGYLANDSIGRYWATAFLHIAYKEGWYSKISADDQCSHLEGEERFVLNGVKIGKETNEVCGMLIEGDYWYNESKKNGAMNKFKSYVTNKTGRQLDLQWMSMPTLVTGYVTGVGTAADLGSTTNRATDLPIVNSTKTANEHVDPVSQGASIYINSRYKNNTIIVDMLKDFMKFLHTDDALSYYTGSQGVYRCAMSYDVKEEHVANLSDFQKSTLALVATSEKPFAPAIIPDLYDYDTFFAKNSAGSKNGWLVSAKNIGLDNYGNSFYSLFTCSSQKQASWKGAEVMGQ